MNVAIIGGGVSGLFVAYLLQKQGGYNVTLYEGGSVGGNCYTANATVGTAQRWADLAVNDFNQPQYQEVVDIMDALGVAYRDLEDTACFFHQSGDVAYTLDGGYQTPMPPALASLYAQFQANAPSVMSDPQYFDWTVQDYLTKVEPFAGNQDFANLCIYPRVAAMYFCSDDGAAGMPIQAVLHYYVLQEGFGTTVPPRRRYFVGGSHQWIVALKQACNVNVIPQTAALDVSTGALVVNGTTYDRVVFAGHAEDVLNAYPGAQTDIQACLRQFSYTQSYATAHVFPGVLAGDPRAHRTYNVLIRDNPQSFQGYSMSYVINHHQADLWNPQDNYWDGQQYYVTLNAQTDIPASAILSGPSGAIYNVPFRHNVLDQKARVAQQTLWSAHSGTPIQGRFGVYFTGGWTTGAGLHIECYHSAVAIVNLLQGAAHADQHVVADPRRPPEQFAAHYLRNV